VNSIHILFHTGRFNLSQVGEHFINPCCFGEDLAMWLRAELIANGVESSSPGQEDWGWYLKVRLQDSYLIGVSGNAEQEAANKNYGEWRIIIQKHRLIWQKLTGKGLISADDRALQTIEGILRAEPDFQNIHREIQLR
jgi:hypothetical protein